MNSRFVLSCVSFALLVGCGASHRPTVHAATGSDAEVRAEALYSDALAEAMDTHERDVRTAATAWYATYGSAYATSKALVAPDLSEHVEAALIVRGRTVEQLNAFAEAHPEFVREQNRVHQARLSALRPMAFAVMGRINRNRAAPELRVTPVDPAPAPAAVATLR